MDWQIININVGQGDASTKMILKAFDVSIFKNLTLAQSEKDSHVIFTTEEGIDALRSAPTTINSKTIVARKLSEDEVRQYIRRISVFKNFTHLKG